MILGPRSPYATDTRNTFSSSHSPLSNVIVKNA